MIYLLPVTASHCISCIAYICYHMLTLNCFIVSVLGQCHSLHMQRNCPMSCSGIASGYQMIIPKMPPGAVLGVLHRRYPRDPSSHAGQDDLMISHGPEPEVDNDEASTDACDVQAPASWWSSSKNRGKVKSEPLSTPAKPRSTIEVVKCELSPLTPSPVTCKSQRTAPNSKKWLSERAKEGKVVADQAGLDYNKHFQVVHRGSFEAGHWQDFLASLAGAQVSRCERCAQLCIDFKLSCAAYAAGPTVMTDGEIVLVSDDDQDMALEPRQLFPSSAPRPRAGRPSRADQRLNLTEWISQKRPGQYIIHSLDGQVPVSCRLCGVTFNAHRTGSPWYIERHEQEDSRHRRAAEGLPPQEEDAPLRVCEGIGLMDPGSGLQHLKASVMMHIQNGHMATIKCAVHKVHFFVDAQGHVRMQSKKCREDRSLVPAGKTVCRTCEAHSRKQELVRSLASWVHRADSWLVNQSVFFQESVSSKDFGRAYMYIMTNYSTWACLSI